FSSRINTLTTANAGIDFGPVSGIATANTTGTNMDSLSSNTACTAQNLSVLITAAPGGTKTRLFELLVGPGGANTVILSCTVTSAATTCNSGATTATISAGSRIGIRDTVSSGGGAAAAANALVGGGGGGRGNGGGGGGGRALM